MSSFHLHQSTENFLRTISLVYILYSPKNHNLDELIRGCKAYTTELCKAFPRNTPEEERLFDLLQRSYIESRYNPNFEITKDDICALVPKVELLKQIVEKVCRERFDYYDSRISEMSEGRLRPEIGPVIAINYKKDDLRVVFFVCMKSRRVHVPYAITIFLENKNRTNIEPVG